MSRTLQLNNPPAVRSVIHPSRNYTALLLLLFTFLRKFLVYSYRRVLVDQIISVKTEQKYTYESI